MFIKGRSIFKIRSFVVVVYLFSAVVCVSSFFLVGPRTSQPLPMNSSYIFASIYSIQCLLYQFSFSSQSIPFLPILLLSFYFLNSYCLLINFLFRLSIYSNIVPFVDFDFSSSIILISVASFSVTHVAAEMHKYKDKKSCCAVTRSLFKTLLDPHYDYIGVSFSIFLNLDDCQEYGQKENVLD